MVSQRLWMVHQEPAVYHWSSSSPSVAHLRTCGSIGHPLDSYSVDAALRGFHQQQLAESLLQLAGTILTMAPAARMASTRQVALLTGRLMALQPLLEAIATCQRPCRCGLGCSQLALLEAELEPCCALLERAAQYPFLPQALAKLLVGRQVSAGLARAIRSFDKWMNVLSPEDLNLPWNQHLEQQDGLGSCKQRQQQQQQQPACREVEEEPLEEGGKGARKEARSEVGTKKVQAKNEWNPAGREAAQEGKPRQQEASKPAPGVADRETGISLSQRVGAEAAGSLEQGKKRGHSGREGSQKAATAGERLPGRNSFAFGAGESWKLRLGRGFKGRLARRGEAANPKRGSIGQKVAGSQDQSAEQSAVDGAQMMTQQSPAQCERPTLIAETIRRIMASRIQRSTIESWGIGASGGAAVGDGGSWERSLAEEEEEETGVKLRRSSRGSCTEDASETEGGVSWECIGGLVVMVPCSQRALLGGPTKDDGEEWRAISLHS